MPDTAPLETNAPNGSTLPLDALSPSTASTPPANSENATEGDVEAANPIAINPETPPPDPSPKEPRVSRALAEAAKRERRAAEREAKARDLLRQAELQTQAIQKLQAQRDHDEAVFRNATKDPDSALAALKRLGFNDVDALARTLLATPPEPDIKAELQTLKQQLADRAAAEKAAYQKAQFESLNRSHIARTHEALNSKPDDYEFIIAKGLYPEVVDRAYAFIREHNLTEVSPEDEIRLVHYCAENLEKQLVDAAKAEYEELSKRKKLGIAIKPNTDTSTQVAADPEVEKVASQMRAKRSTKFITNETTITSRPTPRETRNSNASRRDDQLIEEAIRSLTTPAVVSK